MNQLQIINYNGQHTVESRQVAEMIEKDHSKLLRDIRQYCEYLSEAKIGLGEFFIESTYLDSNKQYRPCFLLTKKGCDMVANKLTGAKGTLFSAAYVTKFEEMERQIVSNQQNLLSGLSPELQAIIIHDKKIQKLELKFEELPLLGVDCEELQKRIRQVAVKALGGYKSNAYDDNSIRQKVFTDIQKQIKREYGVATYKGIKRNQLEIALSIVDKYMLPMVLKNEIDQINNQTQMAL